MAAPHDLPLTGLKPAAPRKLAATADKPVAPKKPAVRRPAVMSAQQQAQQIVAQELNPLVNQQRTFSNQQNTAIANFTKMLLDAVKGTPAQIGAGYDKAIGTQTSIANAAADALRNANPNQQNQAILNAVGAPDAQKSQIASSLADTFNGGAAVGQYRNLLNTNDLQAGKLASMNIASTLPAVEGLRGHQALQNALFKQSSDMAQITGQRPKLFQDALSSIYDQQAKQQQLNYEAQALGVKTQNQQFQQKYDVAKLGQTDRRLAQQQTQFYARQNQQVKAWNAKQTDAASKISPSVSSGIKDGYAHNSKGAIVDGADGKPIKFTAKTSAAAAARQNKLFGDLTKTQVSTLRATAYELRFGTKDAAGKTKPPKPYPQAVTFLIQHGFSRKNAVAMLNNFYPPGVAGRGSKRARAQVKQANTDARKGKDATGLGIIVQ